jgi:hypothetical protein
LAVRLGEYQQAITVPEFDQPRSPKSAR